MKVSPAKKLLRTNGTVRSTLGLSVGVRTRAGSITNPLAWAYSTNAWFKRGSIRSALVTAVDMLSGITTLNTPPKNSHAASQPSMSVSTVWLNDNHTKECLEYTAVKINAQHTRRRPLPPSKSRPILPKSICNSAPGSPSAIRTVERRTDRPTPSCSRA